MKNLWLADFRKMVFEIFVCTVKPEKLFSTKTKRVDLNVVQKWEMRVRQCSFCKEFLVKNELREIFVKSEVKEP